MSAIENCLNNNTHYATRFVKSDSPAAPSMKLAIVTCMDTRIDPSALLGLAPGEANVIRNAGGIVTDDVIRSLAVSQHLLGTREIMLIHHTDCGMLRFTDEEARDAIENEAGIRPSFEMGVFSSLEDNVRQSIAAIEASPFVLCEDGIRGFVCDLETGKLREIV